MTEIAIIVPTIGRPERLGGLAAKFRMTSPPHRMVFVCDRDDQPSITAASCFGQVVLTRGGYPQAVNEGIAASAERYILVAADDVKPHPDWFEHATAAMTDRIGLVAPNDLGSSEVMAGEYATFPFVARWYITRHGPLYDQAFRHNGADIDASLRARQRGAFAYAPDAVVEHVHPNYGKADVDDTYLHGGLDPAKNKADDLLLWGRWRLELEAMGRSLDAAA
jgi:GT2 family glycosyltransferase